MLIWDTKIEPGDGGGLEWSVCVCVCVSVGVGGRDKNPAETKLPQVLAQMKGQDLG